MLPSLATRNSQSVMNRLELMFDLLNFILLLGIKFFVKSSLKHKILFSAQLFSSRIFKKNSSHSSMFVAYKNLPPLELKFSVNLSSTNSSFFGRYLYSSWEASSLSFSFLLAVSYTHLTLPTINWV